MRQVMGEKELNIRAYLSYRRDDAEREELEALIDACNAKNIALVYDEIGTESGENFVDFMNNEVVGARFVIAFLSPDYFTRPYTLHELLEIAKDRQASSRLSFAPVRQTKGMVCTAITSILDTWNQESPDIETLKTKEELAKRQGKVASFTDLDDTKRQEIFTELAAQIEEAWNSIVRPELEQVTDAAAAAKDIFRFYTTVADNIVAQAKKELEGQRQELRKKVVKAVASILGQDRELCNVFISELAMNDGVDFEGIAIKLVDMGAYEAITTLGRISDHIKGQPQYRADSEHWQKFCYRAKQLCGWLLLLSVDPHWWIHNCYRINHCMDCGISLSLNPDSPGFSEVIISRTVLEQARFKLDDRGDQLIPDRSNIKAYQFDISDESVKESLLQPIYKDLKRISSAPDEQDNLLEGIIIAATTTFDRTKKPVFYLISGETSDLLTGQEWYQTLVGRLAGKLLFIRTDIDDNSCAQKSCGEDTATLLEAVAYIYRLENE